MSANWPLVSIEDIKAPVKGAIAIGPFGSRMKSDCYVEKGIPVIRGTNITGGPTFEGNFVYITKEKAETLGSSNVYQHDLVFPHRGSIGEVGIILDDEHFVLSSSLMKLTCDISRVNPKFLYYFFKSRMGRHELLKNASQVGTPGIGQPLSSLKSIEFRLPPLEVQDQIAGTLTSLDQKIELNRQTNQTLENIAQAIFKSWFVDFGPTRAKIAVKENGGDPQLAAMAAIAGKSIDELETLSDAQLDNLKSTAALFPDKLVESESGEIPEGWKIGSLSDICFLNKESWTKKNAPETVCYVDLANTKNGVIGDVQCFPWSHAPSRAKRKLNIGDTIVGTVRPGNRSYSYIGKNEKQLTGSTGFAVLTPSISAFTEFLFLAATSDENIERLSHLADGGAYPAVRPDVVTQMEIVIPLNPVVSRFRSVVKPFFELRDANLIAESTLRNLRDTLLPKLLSGEIDIQTDL